MKRIGRMVLYAACFPVDVFAVLVTSVLALTVGQRVPVRWFDRGCLVFCPPIDSWLARRWRFSATLGHVIMVHPLSLEVDAPEVRGERRTHYERTMDHECVHVAQCEAVCLGWLLVMCAQPTRFMAFMWPFAWLLAYLVASTAGMLVGRSGYLGNVLESHADGSELP